VLVRKAERITKLQIKSKSRKQSSKRRKERKEESLEKEFDS